MRELRTMVEVGDEVLLGQVMPALMKIIGRVKALAEISSGRTSVTWEIAQHHELVETDGMGLLTRRDRQNAASSQREARRLAGSTRGTAMRPHGRDAG